MFRRIAILLPLLLIFSCRGSSYRNDISGTESFFYDNSLPYHASRKLIGKVNDKGKDQLLYMMEAGSLLHTSGDFSTSNKLLLQADAMSAKSVTSLSDESLALVTNEKKKDYRPIVYEQVAVNVITGLNFLAEGEYESAMVEFRKVNYKLEREKQKDNSELSENIFARYMAAVAALSNGEKEYAYIELKKIHKLSPGIEPVGTLLYQTALELGERREAESWRQAYAITPPPEDAVPFYIVHEAGKIPVRKSRGPLLEEEGTEVLLRAAIQVAIITQSADGITVAAGMAALSTVEHPIPDYEEPAYDAVSMDVEVFKDGESIQRKRTTTMIDMGDVFVKNLEAHYPAMRKKMITRIAAKVVSSLVAKYAAEKVAKQSGASGGVALLTGLAAGVAVGATTLASESPDLRCWHTLPDRYGSQVFFLPPGEYTARLTYRDAYGNALWSREMEPFLVEKDKPQVYLARTTM